MRKLKQIVPEDNLTIAEREYTKPILPVDLLIDIFSRVPSKYVARFRCLSKSWASILVDPYFTELFLTMSSNRPRLLFSVNHYGKLLFFSTPQTQIPSSVATCCDETHPFHREITSSISLLHGLVFCNKGRRNYSEPMICNPATGELLTLPELNSGLYYPVIYFGYDPTSRKFKLLCTAAYHNTNRAWVLTLETGKLLWRMIECEYHRVLSNQGQMICIDGVLYYLAYPVSYLDFVIVCFDVKSEKFSFINIDDKNMHHDTTLINYKGRLGVVQFKDINQRILCMWLLEEDAAGVINKWSRNIYELPLSRKHPFTKKLQIVGMTRTCDLVLAPRTLSHPFYVFYYNVERKTLVARTEIQGLQELKSYSSPIYIFPDYVEDLKPMKNIY